MTEINKVLKASDFASKAHAGQIRKNSKFPYIIHPLRVAETIARFTENEDVITAGVLHDIIEETDYDLKYIEKQFGARVAELVDALSEPNQTQSWKERKTHTINYLKHTSDKELLLVSCADKLDNLVSLKRDCLQYGDCAWNFFKSGQDQQRWYYESLAKVYMDFDKNNKLFKKFHKSVQKVFRPPFHQKVLSLFGRKS